jgi:hypothetical protein
VTRQTGAPKTTRTGRSEHKNMHTRRSYQPLRIGRERGITTGGQATPVTLSYQGKWSSGFVSSRVPGYSVAVGRVSRRLRRAPQKPHNAATRCLIPTEIPRTKRHTPVHLLCVLEVWKIAAQQRRCARAGLLAHFPGKRSRDDRPPVRKRTLRQAHPSSPPLHLQFELQFT